MAGSWVLIGPMGSGKSTVGQELAKRLHVDFVDLDASVEAQARMTIPEIFEKEGEEGFRVRETQALAQALERPDIVIACGGGIVMREENIDAIRSQAGLCIYLNLSPEQQCARVSADQNNIRPLLQDTDALQRLQDLYTVRDPLYRSTADVVVDADQALHDVVQACIDCIEEHQ